MRNQNTPSQLRLNLIAFVAGIILLWAFSSWQAQTLPRVLEKAYLVQFHSPCNPGYLHGISTGSFVSGSLEPSKTFVNDARNTWAMRIDMLSLLQNCHDFHSTPPQGKPDFEFDVLSIIAPNTPFAHKTGFHYQYVSVTGELGRNHEWCYVPDKLKVWMLNVKARLPKKDQISGDGL